MATVREVLLKMQKRVNRTRGDTVRVTEQEFQALQIAYTEFVKSGEPIFPAFQKLAEDIGLTR